VCGDGLVALLDADLDGGAGSRGAVHDCGDYTISIWS
jgi:hypothetical protein